MLTQWLWNPINSSRKSRFLTTKVVVKHSKSYLLLMFLRMALVLYQTPNSNWNFLSSVLILIYISKVFQTMSSRSSFLLGVLNKNIVPQDAQLILTPAGCKLELNGLPGTGTAILSIIFIGSGITRRLRVNIFVVFFRFGSGSGRVIQKPGTAQL